MEIGPVSNRPAGQRTDRTGKSQQDATPPAAPKPSVEDRADISVEARARLAELADQERLREQQGPEPVTAENLSNEDRLEIIRKRVLSGYYDDPKIKARIADRLIDGSDK